MGGNIAAMYLIGDLSLQLNNKYINNPIWIEIPPKYR
jgi:hypothetical protein